MITPFGYVYYTALSRYAGEEKKKNPSPQTLMFN